MRDGTEKAVLQNSKSRSNLLLNLCKIEVRHILFQKIGFTIF